MARLIRPRRVHWPAAFWRRAETSFADNDLLCQGCMGRGCRLSREAINEDTTPEDVACPACRGSGLLVPAREVPDDVEGMLAAEEAGGCWLDGLGHTGDGLVWPLPWAWRIGRRFPVRRDVYLSDEDVLAFMQDRNVVVGLFRRTPESRKQLEAVFRLACGEAAALPEFVLPAL